MSSTEMKFEDFKLNKQLLSAVAEIGLLIPTPIQEKTIPRILGGHDILGIAPTGTGKTAAFGLPVLMKAKYAQGTTPRVVIFGPTKELVLQIGEHLTSLARYTDLRIRVLFGGIGPTTQIKELEEGVDILVATPGRFLELYSRGAITTRQVNTLVLDEADKMMDMGFMPQIRKILEVIPVKRQNLLFSATMSEKVIRLSEEFLEFPERIEVAPSATPAESVSQKIYYTPNRGTKINLLMHLLRDPKLSRIMVFTRSRKTADAVAKYIARKGEDELRVIHSNKGQNTRINAMEAFKQGNVRLLLTTDVSSRGIDVSDVSHVVNFDVPVIYEDYVHRIGRTGRARKLGASITFVNDAEKYHIKKIEKLIRSTIPVFDIP
jgi:ATP-dependent RNA helicase RhlE